MVQWIGDDWELSSSQFTWALLSKKRHELAAGMVHVPMNRGRTHTHNLVVKEVKAI